ncbi:hypothetical protein AHAS_Ahas16G0002200 [Arachis hypogaea]
MEFWIQVHGLPIENLNAKTTKIIGNLIGIMGEVKNPINDRILERNFLRFRVAINISQPLQISFWLNRNNKAKTWISFKYERLHDCFCLNCGVIRHEKKNCNKPVAMACWDPTKPRFTKDLATKRVKPLNAGKEEEKWEQRFMKHEEAREHHAREDEGSQSSDNIAKDQRILEVLEIKVSSGKARG